MKFRKIAAMMLLILLTFLCLGALADWDVQVVENTRHFSGMESSNALVYDPVSENIAIAYGQYGLHMAVGDGLVWDIQSLDESPGVGKYVSIDLDNERYPHIGYSDEINHMIKHAYLDGSGWNLEFVNDVGDLGHKVHLKCTEAGTIFLTYAEKVSESDYNLHLAYRTSSTWVYDEVVTSGNVGLHHDLSVSLGGLPGMAYVEEDTGDLIYAQKVSNVWNFETVASGAVEARYPSVWTSDDGYSHIAYRDDAGQTLEYAEQTLGGWNLQTLVGAGDPGHYIASNPGIYDYSHILYQDADSGSLQYVRNTLYGWVYETVAEGPDTGYFPSAGMVASAIGSFPLVAYLSQDEQEQTILNYHQREAGGWLSSVDVDRSVTIPARSHMISDRDGYPAIAYLKEDGTTSVKLARRTDGNWTLGKVEEMGDLQEKPAFSFNLAGDPHVLFPTQVGAGAPVFRHVYKSSGVWQEESLPDASGGFPVDAAIDDNDVLKTIYRDPTEGRIRYAFKDSGAWTVETVTADNGDGHPLAMDLDQSNLVHFVHQKNGEFDLHYVRQTGSDWSFEVLDDTAQTGYGADLQLNESDEPWVSYYEGGSSPKMIVSHRSSGAWTSEILEALGSLGEGSGLALDASGYPHVVYQDLANVTLKHGYKDATGWHLSALNAGTDTKQAPSILIYPKEEGGVETYIAYADQNASSAFCATDCELLSDFSADETEICEGGTVNFTAAPNGAIRSYFWTFGDGQSEMVRDPIHTYSSAGDYSVTLTVRGPCGADTETKPFYMNVRNMVTADFSGSPLEVLAGQSVSFSNLTIGDANTYSWDFGDGGTSTLLEPEHTYNSIGVFDVSLTSTGVCGSDTESKTEYVTVSCPLPSADFTVDQNSGEAPLSVVFTDTSVSHEDCPITTWLWNFGDGETSTEQHPTHTYTTSGAMTVSLTVTSAGGSDTETKVEYIAVGCVLPTAEFESNATSGVSPFVVSFSDLSTNDPNCPLTDWEWNFGDGEISSEQNPVHQYDVPGSYSVSLTVTNAMGSDSITKTDYITVLCPLPTAAFSVSTTSGNAPLSVIFTDESQTIANCPLMQWSWDFGDGGTNHQPNPVHTYSAVGIYTVSMTVQSSSGSDTITKTDLIEVNCQPPMTGFSGTPTEGVSGTMVQFADESLSPIGCEPDSWEWTFGDGDTSTQQNPAHIYNSDGYFDVTMSACNSGGCTPFTREQYIHISCLPPEPDFSAEETAGIAPAQIQFYDETVTGVGCGVSTWIWDFGDGTQSSEQNPLHTYDEPGTYAVSLSVENSGGQQSETRQDFIIVYGSAAADFIATPSSGAAPLPVTFSNQSEGTVDAFFWDFGDGTTSSLENPEHVFVAPGVYTVTLTISGLGGNDVEVKEDYITVYTPTGAEFSADPIFGIAPTVVDFTDESTGDMDSWSWNFGDGDTSTQQHPSHVYSLSGIYSVTLAVDGPGGQSSQIKNDFIVIYEPTVASFHAAPLAGPAPWHVQFYNDSTGDWDTSLWSFGDGTTSDADNTSHTYSEPGTYSISLTVSGNGGSDSVTRNSYITIYSPSNAAFSATPTTGQEPLMVSFTDLSEGDVNVWLWDFGDGGTSNLRNPVYTYTEPGIYDVLLAVSGPGGNDVELKQSYIVAMCGAPASYFTASPTSGTTPHTVSFTNETTSVGSCVDGWLWNFGDGYSSTTENPTYVYQTPGVYTVSLVASGSGGSNTHVRSEYIHVLCPVPESDLQAYPRSGFAPLTTFFTEEATAGLCEIDSYYWDFGDGNTSTDRNPVHVYSTPGSFNVDLTVYNTDREAVATKSEYVTVYCPTPDANFTATSSVGEGPLTVQFFDSSESLEACGITSWVWDFGDGHGSSQKNPQHTFNEAGYYTVTLVVSNEGGQDARVREEYVEVRCPEPDADFTATPMTGAPPLNVTFEDISETLPGCPVASCSWDFGDGQGSNDAGPEHTYEYPGSYTVQLEVETEGGTNTEVKEQLIVVSLDDDDDDDDDDSGDDDDYSDDDTEPSDDDDDTDSDDDTAGDDDTDDGDDQEEGSSTSAGCGAF